MPFTYKYPRPALTVDIVVLGYHEHKLSLLLIQRALEPFKGQWALPGGFVQVDEDLEAAALRELREEAGVQDIYLEQLYTFGALQRDPRERVVSVAYFALVQPSDYNLKASTDALKAKWFPFEKLPKLAFDHQEIVTTALKRLRNKVRYEPIGFELLPKEFTLSQLQDLYETVLDQDLDKRNFRKKILKLDILKELDEKVEDVPYRSPTLYRFDVRKYQALLKKGLQFEI